MNNHQLINYIKIREAWKDTLRAKSSALSSIWSGLIKFGTFLTYWAVEKFLLNYDEIYKTYPNFKYVFYLSLAFGLWGVLDSLLGLFQFIKASKEAEQLKEQVEQLERELERQ